MFQFFTLLAHNCHCPACQVAAQDELGAAAGQVCGHFVAHGQPWACVYCGGPVQRFTPWYAALWQSLCSGLSWVKWEWSVSYCGVSTVPLFNKLRWRG